MRIGSAIYQLSEIQRANHPARSDKKRSRPAPATQDQAPSATSTSMSSAATPPNVERPRPTLAGLLRDHFISEVRQRDRDGDGSLDRSEYGGAAEDFHDLDRDGDGLIGAQDLTRGALDRSPQLADMVKGRWAPIYNQLLNMPNSDEDSLVLAIHEGAADVYQAQEQERLTAQTGNADQVDDPEVSTPSELFVEFVSQHRDLTSLHQRIHDLADRLGRSQPYTPVNLLA